MSTVRLLPNHPCQEEEETPGPMRTVWEALRKFTIVDAEWSRLCLSALCASPAGLEEVACARGSPAGRYVPSVRGSSEEEGPEPPVSFLSGLRPRRWTWVSRD